jgi:hypothetical protein
MTQPTADQVDTLSLNVITRTQSTKLKKKVTWASPEVTKNDNTDTGITNPNLLPTTRSHDRSRSANNPRTKVQIPSGALSKTSKKKASVGVNPSLYRDQVPVTPHIKPTAPRAAAGFTLTKETLQKIENVSKLRFSLDLNAFKVGNTDAESVKHCATLQEAMDTDVKNHEVLLYGTRGYMKLLLQKLKTQIQTKIPFKACCAVPMMHLNSLRNELSLWTHLHTLKKDSYSIHKH